MKVQTLTRHMQPCLHPYRCNSRGHCLGLCPNCLHSQTLSYFLLVSSVLIFSPLLHLMTYLIEFYFITCHVTTSTITSSLVDTTLFCSCPTRLDSSPRFSILVQPIPVFKQVLHGLLLWVRLFPHLRSLGWLLPQSTPHPSTPLVS